MATFQILPAIDLLGGRVVRLRQGDFADSTTFSDDPLAVARAFVDGGARWLHVVDLDGARAGRAAHGEVIGEILDAVGERAAVEVAGGLRSIESVEEVLELGAARAVLGTLALGNPALAAELIGRHGQDRIAVALDVRDGAAVGHGWVRGGSGVLVQAAMARLLDAGVRWFEVTSIARDGMLGGPDLEVLRGLAGDPRASIIASGGIGSADDLRAVHAIGCAGAIVGRALYDGSLTLAAALSAIADA